MRPYGHIIDIDLKSYYSSSGLATFFAFSQKHQYCVHVQLPYSRVGIPKTRALCDNFLKLYMVLGMDMTF